MNKLCKQIISVLVLIPFMGSLIIPVSSVQAQTAFNLPVPGTMIGPSPVYAPVLLKGIELFADEPLRFDFIIDTGDTNLAGEALESESSKLVKYFLAALAISEDDLWVNLSPYEKDRIIPPALEQTELGRDMLAQDYLLKQLMASLMYPEAGVGKDFWERIHAKVRAQFGVTDVPTNMFNKVWIVPDEAGVYVEGSRVFVTKSHLKVMLEEDYLALAHHDQGLDAHADTHSFSEETKVIMRSVIIPEIEREVNQGKNFVMLRQMYSAMILAAWYKKNLRATLLGQAYVDQNKITGIDLKDQRIKEKIYNQYLEAFNKGVYDYIKEDYDPSTQQIIPRKYFSGGLTGFKQTGLVEEVDFSVISEAQEKWKKVRTRFSLLPGKRSDDQGDPQETDDPVDRRGLQGKGDRALRVMLQNLLRHETVRGDRNFYLTSDAPLMYLETLNDIENIRFRIATQLQSKSVRRKLRRNFGEDFIRMIENRFYNFSENEMNTESSEIMLMGAKPVALDDSNEFSLGFYARDPYAQKMIQDLLPQGKLRDALSGHTLVLPHQLLEIKDKNLLREYLFYAFVTLNGFEYSHELGNLFFPENYWAKENDAFPSKLKDVLDKIVTKEREQYQKKNQALRRYQYTWIDLASVRNGDPYDLKQRIDQNEEGAFEQGLQYVFGMMDGGIVLSALINSIRKNDDNKQGRFEVLERYLRNVILESIAESNLAKQSEVLIEAAANAGHPGALRYLVDMHLRLKPSSYIQRALDDGNQDVVAAFLGREDELIRMLKSDSYAVNSRALDVLPMLINRGLSVNVLGEAVLISSDKTLQKSMQRMIEEKYPDAISFFRTRKDEIVNKGKSYVGLESEMLDLIYVAAEANVEDAIDAILESESGDLLKYLLGRVRNEDSWHRLVLTKKSDVIAGLVVSSEFWDVIKVASEILMILASNGVSGAEDEIKKILKQSGDVTLQQSEGIDDTEKGEEGNIKKISKNFMILEFFFPALAKVDPEKKRFIESMSVLLSDILDEESERLFGDQDSVVTTNAQHRFTSSLQVLGQYTVHGFAEAKQAIERHIPTFKRMIESGVSENRFLSNIFIALGGVALNNPNVEKLIRDSYAKRGIDNVLPADRAGKSNIAVVVIDFFKDEEEDAHGVVVEDAVRESMGQGEKIPIHRIDISRTDGNSERFIEEQLEDLERKFPNTVFVVNLSAFSKVSSDHVNGILNFDMVRRLGQQGFVFTVGASNSAGSNYTQFPDLDNIVVVGAVERSDGEWIRSSYSNIGPDVTIATHGRVGSKQGTSFAAPRVNGLLARMLHNDPALSSKDALNQLLEQAKPMDDKAFTMGFFGSGYLDVEDVLSGMGFKVRTTVLDRQALTKNPQSLLAALRAGRVTTEEMLEVPWRESYLSHFFHSEAEEYPGFNDPLLKPFVMAGLQSRNELLQNGSLENIWLYTDPEVLPILVDMTRSKGSLSLNPANMIVDNKIQDPRLLPILLAGFESEEEWLIDEIVQKATWAYTHPKMIPILTEIAKTQMNQTTNPAYIITENNMRDPALRPILEAGLENEEDLVRTAVREFLGDSAALDGSEANKGGIDFDLRNIAIDETGPGRSAPVGDMGTMLDYAGIKIESLVIEDFAIDEVLSGGG